jgi:hypothetical protein
MIWNTARHGTKRANAIVSQALALHDRLYERLEPLGDDSVGAAAHLAFILQWRLQSLLEADRVPESAWIYYPKAHNIDAIRAAVRRLPGAAEALKVLNEIEELQNVPPDVAYQSALNVWDELRARLE